ncbi:MAG: SRPBCC family protein [Gemmatimonadetes bacterium]|nr:SRPBCC family protein [Gemmatimonadota bacterium]
MKLLKTFITGVALLLLTFVGVGFALSGTWEVERSAVLPGTPETVFGFLDSVEGWSSWAAIGAVEGAVSGPARGAGATLTWDSREWGEGRWELLTADAPREVSYEVAVEGGSMLTRGRVSLTAGPDGTRIDWVETGDFGWNPFLAYMALGMDRMQGREMEKGLAELRARVEESGPPPSGR